LQNVNAESRKDAQTAQNVKTHECGLDKEILREYLKDSLVQLELHIYYLALFHLGNKVVPNNHHVKWRMK
jgi:hypothetical protein